MIKVDKRQKPYMIGFIASSALTLMAYILVVTTAFSKWVLFGAIIFLAIIQLMVQVVFFLHLGREEKPRFKLLTFSFAILVVLVIVLGSVWIMANLNYHHVQPQDPNATSNYIIQDEGITR